MSTDKKSRPGVQAETTRDASDNTPIVPCVRAEGRVRIDLRRMHQDYDIPSNQDLCSSTIRRACFAPRGAEIVFQVGPRQFYPGGAIEYVREHGRHLGLIVVECDDPETVSRWVRALRGGMA